MDAERKSETWAHLLRSKANRKSFAICIVVPMLTLWNGQGVIAYYFSPILKSIGISNTNQITGINGGLQIWNLLCSVIGVLLAERMGRRKLWLTSFFGMMLANVPFTIASAMYTKNGSDAAARAVVVFLFLYDAAFNIGCNPLPYCYTIEVLPFGIRSKGMGLTIAVGEIALAVNQYVNPVALDSIGYYYYIFYLGMLVVWVSVEIYSSSPVGRVLMMGRFWLFISFFRKRRDFLWRSFLCFLRMGRRWRLLELRRAKRIRHWGLELGKMAFVLLLRNCEAR